MKKMILVPVVVISAMMLTMCSIRTTVPEGIGVPESVTHIEFWNGGTCIREYDNATVVTKIDTRANIVGEDIFFYRYVVTAAGKTETIVDSEALSIVWTE
jgi:hypothetical protein